MLKQKVVAIIPMRSGSVRLPSKNKRIFCGKPLYLWTIEQAQACDFIDEIIITTDDEDIISGYLDLKQPDDKLKLIIRPDFLSTSDTPVWPVIEHACLGYRDDTIVILLQVTSPLRTIEDIENAWTLFNINRNAGVISGSYTFPDHNIRINGAIYIYYLSTIVNTKSFIQNGMIVYLMPYERSIDIDNNLDWNEAERLLKKR